MAAFLQPHQIQKLAALCRDRKRKRDEAERLTAIGRSRGLGPGGRGAGGVEDVGAALDAGGLPRAGAPDGSGAKGGGGRGRGAKKVKPGDAAAAAVKP